MMDFTELQWGDMSPLMRHERARPRAQVPGKAHRQMLTEMSRGHTSRMALLMAV